MSVGDSFRLLLPTFRGDLQSAGPMALLAPETAILRYIPGTVLNTSGLNLI